MESVGGGLTGTVKQFKRHSASDKSTAVGDGTSIAKRRNAMIRVTRLASNIWTL